jgi:isopenicillin N synthase-like dioxygenase
MLLRMLSISQKEQVTMNAPNVPIINLETAHNDQKQIKLLDLACRDHGFFLLKNHGMQQEIDDMWKHSQWFFSQDRKEKLKLLRSEEIPLGFYDRELTKQKRDLKEVFDFMETRTDHDINQWPEEISFKNSMEDFFFKSSEVANQTLDLILSCLGLTENNYVFGDSRTSNARLNFYPINDPLDNIEKDTVNELGDMALHHHTDPGILTLLLQDMTGGLQAKSKEFGWIDIIPEENSIVVNLGDAMQVWTNDNYVAAIHRVLKRTSESRYSTPFFFNPKSESIIEPIPEIAESNPVYKSFTWKQYIRGRIDDNYQDLGQDDIQISNFKI